MTIRSSFFTIVNILKLHKQLQCLKTFCNQLVSTKNAKWQMPVEIEGKEGDRTQSYIRCYPNRYKKE